MIDIENDVFTIVATAIRTAHSTATVVGEFVDVPASFPCVTIVEADNRILEYMRTAKIENGVSVMYEVNIYSNSVNGKKSEAKSIANTLDTAFATLNFTRTFREQIPNLRDSTIYRIVCRYEAVVGENGSGKYLIYQS